MKKTTEKIENQKSSKQDVSFSLESVLKGLKPSSLQQTIILSELIGKPACKRRRRMRSY